MIAVVTVSVAGVEKVKKTKTIAAIGDLASLVTEALNEYHNSGQTSDDIHIKIATS